MNYDEKAESLKGRYITLLDMDNTLSDRDINSIFNYGDEYWDEWVDGNIGSFTYTDNEDEENDVCVEFKIIEDYRISDKTLIEVIDVYNV